MTAYRVNAFGSDFFALVASGVRPVRVVVVFAARLISTGIHHFLPMCFVHENSGECFRIFMDQRSMMNIDLVNCKYELTKHGQYVNWKLSRYVLVSSPLSSSNYA
ncbi:hypothetical protein AVEN_106838-1 [Araneus ventricosus]|uniref:Uncharacterized protein n=1 Tax=Araneus ventricosus TaxID=182803 RepID=A0A4Y2U8U6_ARAVE|nr:hypothetical protein AVEN_97798-1 [Araneus ventricosus]GBO08474.1 hypothetical protein AVEN_106838-1 [Araneus ventricosus]